VQSLEHAGHETLPDGSEPKWMKIEWRLHSQHLRKKLSHALACFKGSNMKHIGTRMEYRRGNGSLEMNSLLPSSFDSYAAFDKHIMPLSRDCI
jgi:hypothetical protein